MVRLGLCLLASLGLCLASGQAPRPAGFGFNASGISNRLLTPNGDGRNDSVVLTFSNPRDSVVTGKVYDLQGRFVADMAPGPVAGVTLAWDGRAGGRGVASGLYVFRLSAEAQSYTGVLVVIR